MSDDETRTLERTRPRRDGKAASGPCLVLAFAPDDRLGDTFVVPEGLSLLGRGAPRDDDHAPRVLPIRQRPGANEKQPPLEYPFLSRVQLEIRCAGDALDVKNVGRAPLVDASGREASHVRVAPGETFAIGDELLFICVERPSHVAAPRGIALGRHPFGEADEHGLVGESTACLRLREAIAFLGARTAHVLLLGPSGTGKEIVAQAIHASSDRKARALVARNAATFPDTLVEAELFGNAANYPNAGMPERAGLVGEAQGSTLFLDEIGELSETLQTKLLRLLDDRAEYQRLGDARRRVADLRIVAATNRGLAALREDVAARFKLRLTVPGLEERREDIPLIARHLLSRIARTDPSIGARFGGATIGLVRALVSHTYTTHVREIESLLWLSIASSPGDRLERTPEVSAQIRLAAPARPVAEVTEEQVRAALARAGGVRERAWRDLGLANRHALKRLIDKYGISDNDGDPDD